MRAFGFGGRVAAAVSCVLLGTLWAPGAGAALVFTVAPSGSDVVASSPGGTLNTNGLSTEVPVGGFALINSGLPALLTGEAGPADLRGVVASFPSSFGGVTGMTVADSATGSVYGVVGNSVLVPSMYVSGDLLGASSATFQNATLASLGVSPGNYVWTLPSGDTVSVNIVPIPAAFWLLTSALGFLGWLRARS